MPHGGAPSRECDAVMNIWKEGLRIFDFALEEVAANVDVIKQVEMQSPRFICRHVL